MKSILVIGDVHGRNLWKKFEDIPLLLSKETIKPIFDYYVFLGDYVDSFDKTNMQILDNLKEIIEFKKKYPDNVILLLGNHCCQYMLSPPHLSQSIHSCSGYRGEMHYDLYELFNKNYDLFQLAFQIDNYLFTHAGVHQGWHVKFMKAFAKTYTDYNKSIHESLSNILNYAFIHRLLCLFDVDHYRGGINNVGGPFWCDKRLTYDKPLKGYHQIVGHTPVGKCTPYRKDSNTSITFCDVQNEDKIHIDDYYLKIKI